MAPTKALTTTSSVNWARFRRMPRSVPVSVPVMITPRYVPFEVAPGVIFALSNRGGEQVDPKTPRSFVVGLMVPRTEAAVDDVFAAWTAKGVTVAEEPHDEIFGRTFVITDPDGNPICVTPVD